MSWIDKYRKRAFQTWADMKQRCYNKNSSHEGFVADCEDVNGDVDKDTARINARRITACVNACEGIPTDALERSKSLDEFMRSMKVIEQQRDSFKDAAEYNKRRAEDAEKQRDELLAATEAIAINSEECLDFDEFTAMLVSIDDYHKLMEAAARAKGEQ